MLYDNTDEAPARSSSATDRAVVLRTTSERDLERIVEKQVQAVIYESRPKPAWLTQVAEAVESGALLVPRTVLERATADDVEAWLSQHLSDGGLAPDVHAALFVDILGLVERLARGTGACYFMVRIFTESPTPDCGFHIDTVPHGAPAWGVLRVYNGAGTKFVEPANVTSVAEFYRYLSRRERLERERSEARRVADSALARCLEREVASLDEARPFLERPGEVFEVPSGAIVAFKHLDASLFWTQHRKAKAWIHCSPMCGAPRLVVNVTSPEPARRRGR